MGNSRLNVGELQSTYMIDFMIDITIKRPAKQACLTLPFLSGRSRKLPSSPRWCSLSAMPPWPFRPMETHGGNRRRRKLPSWWASLLESLCCAGSPSSSQSSSIRSVPVIYPHFGRASSSGSATPILFSIHWSTQPSTRTTTMPSGTCSLGSNEASARRRQRPC